MPSLDLFLGAASSFLPLMVLLEIMNSRANGRKCQLINESYLSQLRSMVCFNY